MVYGLPKFVSCVHIASDCDRTCIEPTSNQHREIIESDASFLDGIKGAYVRFFCIILYKHLRMSFFLCIFAPEFG